MAFYGCSFSFDGVPCEAFDLMLYEIGGESGGGSFASMGEIQEDTVGKRWKPYFYGVKFDKKLQFELTFGVNQERVDEGKYLDRYELDAVARWLTGRDNYAYLTIDQEDMQDVRYRCMVSSMDEVTYGDIPWALRATFTCDSSYAYLYPQTFFYDVSGSAVIDVYNESAHRGYYYPRIGFDLTNGTGFSVVNETDGGFEMKFTGLPESVRHVDVNADTRVITNDQDLNIYPMFNNRFLRLRQGHNTLTITGNGTLTLMCEYPINPGG